MLQEQLGKIRLADTMERGQRFLCVYPYPHQDEEGNKGLSNSKVQRSDEAQGKREHRQFNSYTPRYLHQAEGTISSKEDKCISLVGLE